MSGHARSRRTLHRARLHAQIRRMVDLAEQRVTHQARVTGRLYCPAVATSSEWTDKAGTVHVIQPLPCGGRLKPIKKGGAIVEGVMRCPRCGRDVIVATLPQPHAEAAPAAPDAPDTAAQPTAADTVETEHHEIARFEDEGGPAPSELAQP